MSKNRGMLLVVAGLLFGTVGCVRGVGTGVNAGIEAGIATVIETLIADNLTFSSE